MRKSLILLSFCMFIFLINFGNIGAVEAALAEQASVVDGSGVCYHEVRKIVSVKKATCTAKGLNQIVCAHCDYIIQGNITPALGHYYQAATCTTPKKCKICGIIEGDALGHDYTVATCTIPKKCRTCGLIADGAKGHNYTDATCTTPRKCTRCGYTTGKALGHDYSNETCLENKVCKICGYTDGKALGHDFEEATCTKAKVCKRCGVTEGKALGHDYKEATCTKAKVCKRCGATEGKALGHDFEEATCTKAKVCKRCGITEGKALDHDYKEATCIKSKTCARCGTTEGKVLGHDFEKATCTKAKVCKRCGVTEGKALGHDYSNATCLDNKACKRCGSSEGIALGHDFEEAICTKAKVCKRCGVTEGKALGHDYKEATCTKAKVCKRCGVTEGKALGHDFEEATCTKAKVCKRCGVTEGKALGHDYKEATCTKAKVCKRCGVTEGKALGHDYSNATCLDNKACKRCGVTDGKALGHDFEEATCTKAKTCVRCGMIDGEALGHDLKLVDELKKSTCISEGLGKYKCSKCEYEEEKILEKTEHVYKEKKCSISCKICDKLKEGTTHNNSYMKKFYSNIDIAGHDEVTKCEICELVDGEKIRIEHKLGNGEVCSCGFKNEELEETIETEELIFVPVDETNLSNNDTIQLSYDIISSIYQILFGTGESSDKESENVEQNNGKKEYSIHPFTKDRINKVIEKGSYSLEDYANMEEELETVIENAKKGTRAALVESAMYLLELEYLVPYNGYGGYGFSSYGNGLNENWGERAKTQKGERKIRGLDCTGYVDWIFTNADVKKPSFNWHGDGSLKDYATKLDEIELGDVLQWRGARGNVKDTQTHIAIIVGIDEENIYFAEAVDPGLRLAKLPISKMKNLNTRTSGTVIYLHKIENRLEMEIKDGNFQNHIWTPDKYIERTR